MRRITVDMLRAKRACEEQVERFETLFPDGVFPTEELCVKHAHDFDWDWASEHLLSPPQRAEYERVEGPAWEKYKRVEGPAWEKYERVEGPAWEKYKRVKGQALEEYERVEGQALEEYERVLAGGFAKAWEG